MSEGLEEFVVSLKPRGSDRDLEQRRQRSLLGLDASRDEFG
jgi:hypothetical protein